MAVGNGALGWRTGVRAAAVVVLAGVTSGCFWGQDRYGPSRSAYNPGETALTAGTVGEIAPRWSQPVVAEDGFVLAWNGHVVVKARTSSGEGLRSLDLATGTEEWLVADGIADPGDNAPSIRNGVVYGTVATNDWDCSELGCTPTNCVGLLRAWEVDTGARRPDLDIDFGPIDACAVPKGTGVVGGHVGLFTTYHPTTVEGGYVVRYDFADRSMDAVIDPADHPDHVVMPAALDEVNSRFYFPAYTSGGGSLFEAWSLDGDLLWSQPLEGSVDVRSAMVEGDTAYVLESSSAGSQVRAYDAATGAPRWSGESDGALVQPVVRRGTVFAGTWTGFDPSIPPDATLHAFAGCRAAACPASWTGPGEGDTVSIVAAGDLVYVTAQGPTDSVVRVYAAAGCGQPSCQPLVTIPVSGLASDTLVDQGTLVVSTSTGIHAFGIP